MRASPRFSPTTRRRGTRCSSWRTLWPASAQPGGDAHLLQVDLFAVARVRDLEEVDHGGPQDRARHASAAHVIRGDGLVRAGLLEPTQRSVALAARVDAQRWG